GGATAGGASAGRQPAKATAGQVSGAPWPAVTPPQAPAAPPLAPVRPTAGQPATPSAPAAAGRRPPRPPGHRTAATESGMGAEQAPGRRRSLCTERGTSCSPLWGRLCSGVMSEVTRILSAIEHGDPHAANQLLPLVYDALRQLAAQKLAQEKP